MSHLIVGSIAVGGGIGILGAGIGFLEGEGREGLVGLFIADGLVGSLSGLGGVLIGNSLDASEGAVIIFALGASVLGRA